MLQLDWRSFQQESSLSKFAHLKAFNQIFSGPVLLHPIKDGKALGTCTLYTCARHGKWETAESCCRRSR